MGKLRNRVSQTVSAIGSGGELTLGAAVPGYQTFQAALGAPATGISYVLVDGTAWEVGLGSYGSGVFTRTAIRASSADGAAIAASTSAILSITMLAEDAPADWPVLVVSRNAPGGGGGSFQSLAAGGFNTVELSQAPSVDTHSGWNTSTCQYAVPQDGIYDCQAKVRLKDGTASGISFGIGIDVANQDSAGFFWQNTITFRQGAYNSRTLGLAKGQLLRLFLYYDYNAAAAISAAELIAIRVR
jgi:hypothetical protein